VGPIFDVPIAVKIEQPSVGADQKRAGPAGRIEDTKFFDLLRRLVFAEHPNRLLDDVVDDISRGVIDAAGFLDLWLVLDLSLMPDREADDLAKELLVNLSKDL